MCLSACVECEAFVLCVLFVWLCECVCTGVCLCTSLRVCVLCTRVRLFCLSMRAYTITLCLINININLVIVVYPKVVHYIVVTYPCRSVPIQTKSCCSGRYGKDLRTLGHDLRRTDTQFSSCSKADLGHP